MGVEKVKTYGTWNASGSDARFDAAKVLVLVTILACGIQLCEQLATETLNGTQAFFLKQLGMDTHLNDGMKFARDRVYMIFLLLCAKLGDNGLGRFRTIMLGATVYFAGSIMVSLATHPWISRLLWYLFGALLVLPFSQAAISANILIFGADQYDVSTANGRLMQDHFFWWLSASVHGGRALAKTLLACYGISEGVSHYLTNDSWFVPDGTADPQEYYTVFLASAASFLLAISFFAWGNVYFSAKSFELLPSSSIVGLTQYLVKVSSHCSFQGVALLAAKVVGMTIYISQAVFFWSPELAAPLSYCSAVGVVFSIGGIILFCQDVDWLDGVPKPENQPLEISDVKHFLRLLPLIVLAQISYGVLFMMMNNWYVRQACQMDMRFALTHELDSTAPQMFTAFFDLCFCGTVVAGTPLALFVVNPRIARFCGLIGWQFNDWSRFILGLAFGMASALTAVHCEICRRAAPVLSLTSSCAPDSLGVRAVSAYGMLVPYVLMGISTLYAMPALMTISYRQVPKTMRSLTVVTTIFMMSASQSLVMAISVTMKEHVPHDLDTGHLEYLYYAILAVGTLCFFTFAIILSYQKRRLHFDADHPVSAA